MMIKRKYTSRQDQKDNILCPSDTLRKDEIMTVEIDDIINIGVIILIIARIVLLVIHWRRKEKKIIKQIRGK